MYSVYYNSILNCYIIFISTYITYIYTYIYISYYILYKIYACLHGEKLTWEPNDCHINKHHLPDLSVSGDRLTIWSFNVWKIFMTLHYC